MKLTVKRRMILCAVVDMTQARGYAPSYREIGAVVGLNSTNTVSYQVGVLKADGFLRPNSPNQPRTIALAEGVAVSRDGLVARAVAVSHCPRCLLSLPNDHVCTQIPEENGHA